ncbi:hypothetical protein BFP97_06375 [Roseivirga sp. 4D4]|uniref:hypothetical protein n=1 Tax=Roseivirga sp. 4D4 TaxID=1889784 RepID=UPI00085312EA|nr:hypothetical protein [Roseivirga sp. 4D4]OEK01157.1 hypothetical protein BFP97_06375 [Roseivirga sp. 4D4]
MSDDHTKDAVNKVHEQAEKLEKDAINYTKQGANVGLMARNSANPDNVYGNSAEEEKDAKTKKILDLIERARQLDKELGDLLDELNRKYDELGEKEKERRDILDNNRKLKDAMANGDIAELRILLGLNDETTPEEVMQKAQSTVGANEAAVDTLDVEIAKLKSDIKTLEGEYNKIAKERGLTEIAGEHLEELKDIKRRAFELEGVNFNKLLSELESDDGQSNFYQRAKKFIVDDGEISITDPFNTASNDTVASNPFDLENDGQEKSPFSDEPSQAPNPFG